MSIQPQSIGVIGGGLVGLASALRLAERWPDSHITLYEKETEIGRHQSGRNSNVIHSGIYYRPGSQKARLCRAGKRALEVFCAEESIPVQRAGKVDRRYIRRGDIAPGRPVSARSGKWCRMPDDHGRRSRRA